MNILPLLLFSLIIGALVLPISAAAAQPPDEDLLNKTENLNLFLPEKGTALLGTKESMTEMTDWLTACSYTLIRFFNDTMSVLGIDNTSYAQNMTKTLQNGMNIPAVRR
jgi:hypothetical protein